MVVDYVRKSYQSDIGGIMPARDLEMETYILSHLSDSNKEIAKVLKKNPKTIASVRRRWSHRTAGRPIERNIDNEPVKNDVVKYYGPVMIKVPLRDKIIQPEWLCIDKPPNLRRKYLYE